MVFVEFTGYFFLSFLCFQTTHTNGVLRALDVSEITELPTSAIPAGIECGEGDSPGSGDHVTSIEVRAEIIFVRNFHLNFHLFASGQWRSRGDQVQVG